MKKFLALIFLASCTLGPDHETPPICMPIEYEHAPDEVEKVDLSVWWKQFEDEKLEYLIEEALCCNYDLRIAFRKIEEVRGLYRIDRSVLYPQLQGNFVAVRARRSENLGSDVIESPGSPTEILPTDFSGPLVQNFFQIGFDANWELDLFGKNKRAAEAAFRDLEALEEAALNTQISVLADVARSYVDIRSLQQRIKALKNQIIRSEELIELGASRYKAGLSSYFDVTEAKFELETRKALLPPLQQELKTTINGLAVLLGAIPEKFEVGEGFIPMALGRIPDDLPSKLLCRRPDIRQREREIAAATSRIGVAIADFFPSFSLMGNFGTQANAGDNIFVWPSRFWSIGPTMVWNLFTGGRLIAQVKVANERQKQAILSYEQTILNALKEVEDRLISYFKESERLEALEERLSLNSLNRDLTRAKYDAGLISFDDVLDSEREFYLSEQRMMESQGTLMIQLIGLYKSLGGGWQCFDSL